MKNFHSIKIILIVFLINIIEPKFIVAQDSWTVTTLDNPAPGYLRFDWPNVYDFYLVDNYGLKQNIDTNTKWVTPFFFPLRNGLWIAGVAGNKGKYLLFDQSMKLVDSIPFPPYDHKNFQYDFHDVEILSNEHYLILGQESRTMNLSDSVIGGQKVARIQSPVLIETDRTGTIYWEWKALDHLSITDDVDTDLTQPAIDYGHVNSFVQDIDGNILVSMRNLDEVTKINKQTSQVIWRLGGSKCKKNEFTFINDSNNDKNGFIGFSHQHSISLLQNGNILLYDNGNLKNSPYSRAVEYKIDVPNKKVTKVWECDNPLYFGVEGSTQRLSNGNTLINWGKYNITEVKPDNSIAFELNYDTTVNIYRAWRIVTRMNAVSQNINAPGEYNYNDSVYTTGVTVSVSAVTGKGYTAIEKHNYAPPAGNYDGVYFSKILPYRWVFSQQGFTNISGTFKIKADSLINMVNPEQAIIYKRGKETIGTFEELNTVYDSVKKEISANFTGFGEFAIANKVSFLQFQIIYPNGGDTLVKDSIPKIIRWDKNFDGLVKIQLVRNNKITRLIKDSLNSSAGTFPWIIPVDIPPDTSYKIMISSVKSDLTGTISFKDFTIAEKTSVNEIISDKKDLWITNYPNPFDKTTTFEFYIANAGNASINLFNMQGEKLETIYNKYLEPGRYNITWDSGEITPGVYFYKITNDINYKFGKLLIY